MDVRSDVAVAPDTVSMLALCAEMVSCCRMGSAYALISWSRPLLFG